VSTLEADHVFNKAIEEEKKSKKKQQEKTHLPTQAIRLRPRARRRRRRRLHRHQSNAPVTGVCNSRWTVLCTRLVTAASTRQTAAVGSCRAWPSPPGTARTRRRCWLVRFTGPATARPACSRSASGTTRSSTRPLGATVSVFFFRVFLSPWPAAPSSRASTPRSRTKRPRAINLVSDEEDAENASPPLPPKTIKSEPTGTRLK
jgi:hypothetical protein